MGPRTSRGSAPTVAVLNAPEDKGGSRSVERVPFCVPARDEVARLPVLLQALADQTVTGPVRVALLVNNSLDGTACAARDAARAFEGRLDMTLREVILPAERAHAGGARALAMDLGISVLDGREDAVLISTDADSRPSRNWVANILRAFQEGADIVGGRLVIDDRDPLPHDISRTRALWDHYWAEVRAIEDAIDPVAWDPAPRHGDHTGASLALRVSTYRAAGGVPPIASGEDRALVEAAVAIGARLRHPDDVWTRVSGRLYGRACGGMADHLLALADTLAQGQPVLAPSLDQWRERARWRAELRASNVSPGDLLEAEHKLKPMVADMVLANARVAA
jgi:Glycosyl transferase family 2